LYEEAVNPESAKDFVRYPQELMVKAVELDIKLQLPKATTPPLPRAGAPSIDLARPTRVTAWRENAQMDAEGSVRRGRCSRRPSEDKMENFVIVWTMGKP